MVDSTKTWVKKRTQEIRKTKALQSRNHLKQLLIAERPGEKTKIRQIVNQMPFTEIQPSTPVAPPKALVKKDDTTRYSLRSNAPSRTTQTTAQTPAVEHLDVEDGLSTFNYGAGKCADAEVEEAVGVGEDIATEGDYELQNVRTSLPEMIEQLTLLPRLSDASENEEPNLEELRNAVLCSAHIIKCSGKALPQYALLGSRMSSLPSDDTNVDKDFRVFLNTNIPFSAFICGLQGSGKSHTVSCMIENCLIPSPVLGVLQRPLKALAFHYAEHTSSSSFRPSELAYIANLAPEFHNAGTAPSVTVLVSPSSYPTLKSLYTNLPNVTVRPYLIHPSTLTIGTMLALMSVDQSVSPPLYINTVKNILRQMSATSSGRFHYQTFRLRLAATSFAATQRDFLNQRLSLLDSFLDLSGTAPPPSFRPGHLTVIDLSCPFMDDSTACVLFRIAMDLFLETSGSKIIVVDEAHKYMRATPAAHDLTAALLTTIREQRHYGARVVVATQEPTVSPLLIDLCSLTVIHRFSSPAWFRVLREHIVVGEGEEAEGKLFKRIAALSTGEAVVFAPTAVLGVGALGKEVVGVGVRRRVTGDGGRSVVGI